MTRTPRICDYEGSQYRTDFWEGRGRGYEDRIERDLLAAMLPESGRRLLEVGAGFGRISDEYHMYDQVVLTDYSFSQLQYARQHHGDEGFMYVAANVYELPFQPGVFDGATMIRVIHHMEDVPAVLSQIRSVMAPDGVFILEYANKRNLKALLRHALGQQSWDPNDLSPNEFVELNFNFHPEYMDQALADAGFAQQRSVPQSFFRIGLLKRTLPVGLMAAMERMMQATGWRVAPSVFTRNCAQGQSPDNVALTGEAILRCPRTGSALRREGDTLVSESGLRWAIRDGIYDFKAPID